MIAQRSLFDFFIAFSTIATFQFTFNATVAQNYTLSTRKTKKV